MNKPVVSFRNGQQGLLYPCGWWAPTGDFPLQNLEIITLEADHNPRHIPDALFDELLSSLFDHPLIEQVEDEN